MIPTLILNVTYFIVNDDYVEHMRAMQPNNQRFTLKLRPFETGGALRELLQLARMHFALKQLFYVIRLYYCSQKDNKMMTTISSASQHVRMRMPDMCP